MANLERVPIRYFRRSDPYNYIVDNRPLYDLTNRISLVNQEVTGILQEIRLAAGTTDSLTQRIGTSIRPDGKLKDGVLDDLRHSIENHDDSLLYVRMTTEERSKLYGISNRANNFGLSINSSKRYEVGTLNIEDSSTIKMRMSSRGDIRAHSIIPAEYYHRHFMGMEPLVKCRRDGAGGWIIDEEAEFPIFRKALSRELLNSDSYLGEGEGQGFYFYTNDGVPDGDHDGTPVPYRMGSLELVVNGVETPLVMEPENHDDHIGRFKIHPSTYKPRWINDLDLDTMALDWETPFKPDEDLLEPLDQPSFTQVSFRSPDVGQNSKGQILNLGDGLSALCLELEKKPYGPLNSWIDPPSPWGSDVKILNSPTGFLYSGSLLGDGGGGHIIPWDSRDNPRHDKDYLTWKIIKKIISGTNRDVEVYYLALFQQNTGIPLDPLVGTNIYLDLTYQLRSSFSENSQPFFHSLSILPPSLDSDGTPPRFKMSRFGGLDVWSIKLEEAPPWAPSNTWRPRSAPQGEKIYQLTQPTGFLFDENGGNIRWLTTEGGSPTNRDQWTIFKHSKSETNPITGHAVVSDAFHLVWFSNLPPTSSFYSFIYQAHI